MTDTTYMNTTHTTKQEHTMPISIEQALIHKSRKTATFNNHLILSSAEHALTPQQLSLATGYSLRDGGSFKRRLSWLVRTGYLLRIESTGALVWSGKQQ
jgi:hypothetical protein